MSQYTESDFKLALSSLDPKPLQEKSLKKEKKWECDLDGNNRIYMTYKDGYCFELDEVGRALH